ncbi:MAG: hypothetical protein JSR99_13055 [Proteobacteria bacterium]|nr:hypothetical protein [Pseudomonadota bacterium]
MRHLSISEIVALICDPSDPVKAIAMVRAFFDDSGTHADSRVTAIGGFVASEKDIAALEAQWADTLADYHQYGVTWFHAVDVANCKEEWEKVSLHVCRDAPMRFATAMSKDSYQPIWAAVVNEDFYRYATPEYLARFPTPFDLCFDYAMGALYYWAKGVNAPKVTPMIAHGEYNQRVSDVHKRYRADGDFSDYIGLLAIDSPRAVMPLQMADLLAYEFYNWWRETEYPVDRHRLVDRPVLWRAISRNSMTASLGGCFSGGGMKSAVERFHKRLSENSR